LDDFRRWPKGTTRQLISFARFASLTGEKLLVCLDRGVIEIFRYFAHSRGAWRTSYYTSVSDDGYNLPTVEEFELVLNALAEANEDMSSCAEIVTALEGIALAVSNTGASSSGGCGCIGSGTDDITDFNDGPSEDVPTGEEFPSGFDDRPEYDVYRCKAGYYIIRNYIGTLRNWAGLAGMTGGLTLAVITGLLLLIVPPIGLSLIVAALGIMVGIDFALLSSLSTIADTIEGDIDNMVCQIYNTETTGEAVSAFQDNVRTKIDALALPIPDTFKQITDNLISHDQMSILNVKDASIDALGTEDCSACETDIVSFAFTCDTISGELVSGDLNGGPAVLSSVEFPWSCDPGTPLHLLGLWGPGAGTGSFTLTAVSCGSSGMEYWGVDGSGGVISFPQTGCPPSGSYRELYMKRGSSNTPFTVNVTIA